MLLSVCNGCVVVDLPLHVLKSHGDEHIVNSL